MPYSSISSKDDALSVLEQARKAYLTKAREVAEKIAIHGDGTCTVNQVREVCPPPDEFDGRVMGAIFNTSEWQHDGYLRSSRITCHGRPISRFRLRAYARQDQAVA
jgi:hypothetical protein